MNDTRPPENEQQVLWNGPAAQAWIEARDALDSMFRPFEDLLVEAVAALKNDPSIRWVKQDKLWGLQRTGGVWLIEPRFQQAEALSGGRNFGHLAYQIDDIYATCERLMQAGVPINRPPRDGRMAFIRTPDEISIELLQKGAALPPAEPWKSMSNTGKW